LPDTSPNPLRIESRNCCFASTEEIVVFWNRPKNALLVGLGGGVLTKRVATRYGVEMDAVEIDPNMYYVAKNYFGLKDSEGNVIYWLHTKLSNVNWCLLAEVGKDKLYTKSAKHYHMMQFYFHTGLCIVLTYIGYLIGRYFDKQLKVKK